MSGVFSVFNAVQDIKQSVVPKVPTTSTMKVAANLQVWDAGHLVAFTRSFFG